MHLETFFHYIKNLYQNITFTMEVESNGELTFLDTSIKRDNGKISVLLYRKATQTDQCLQYSAHHDASCNENVSFSLFIRAQPRITKKDDLNKEKP